MSKYSPLSQNALSVLPTLSGAWALGSGGMLFGYAYFFTHFTKMHISMYIWVEYILNLLISTTFCFQANVFVLYCYKVSIPLWKNICEIRQWIVFCISCLVNTKKKNGIFKWPNYFSGKYINVNWLHYSTKYFWFCPIMLIIHSLH